MYRYIYIYTVIYKMYIYLALVTSSSTRMVTFTLSSSMFNTVNFLGVVDKWGILHYIT